GARAAQVHVAVQPLRERRAKEADHREREEMNPAKAQEERPVMDNRNDSQGHENRADNQADLESQLHEHADEMQSEEQNQSACNRRELRAILQKKCADSARRSAEGNEHHRKADNERKRGREEAAARLLALAQLLHANARK